MRIAAPPQVIMHRRMAQYYAVLVFEPLLMFGDGSVGRLVNALLPCLPNRWRDAGRGSRRKRTLNTVVFCKPLNVSCDGGGGNAEALGGLFVVSPGLNTGNDALAQIRGIGFHTKECITKNKITWICYIT